MSTMLTGAGLEADGQIVPMEVTEETHQIGGTGLDPVAKEIEISTVDWNRSMLPPAIDGHGYANSEDLLVVHIIGF
ncbi:hypothetical protein DFS34DRAFT_652496 [Phlyctochytrium arcticum]|nr:hypothetical protein DFS34DRAFT_652496 [Phlyctochytrium arcticum]